MSFGKLPSLARMMANHGPAPVTIVGVQTVPDHQHGGQPERWWARVVAPTLNRVLLFGGIDRIRWTSILHRRHLGAQSGSMTALLQNLANTQPYEVSNFPETPGDLNFPPFFHSGDRRLNFCKDKCRFFAIFPTIFPPFFSERPVFHPFFHPFFQPF